MKRTSKFIAIMLASVAFSATAFAKPYCQNGQTVTLTNGSQGKVYLKDVNFSQGNIQYVTGLYIKFIQGTAIHTSITLDGNRVTKDMVGKTGKLGAEPWLPPHLSTLGFKEGGKVKLVKFSSAGDVTIVALKPLGNFKEAAIYTNGSFEECRIKGAGER